MHICVWILLTLFMRQVHQQKQQQVDDTVLLETEEDAVQQWLDGGSEAKMVGQRSYYNMVHAMQEPVTQPDMLQGGELRPYQLGGLRFLVSLFNNKINGAMGVC